MLRQQQHFGRLAGFTFGSFFPIASQRAAQWKSPNRCMIRADRILSERPSAAYSGVRQKTPCGLKCSYKRWNPNAAAAASLPGFLDRGPAPAGFSKRVCASSGGHVRADYPGPSGISPRCPLGSGGTTSLPVCRERPQLANVREGRLRGRPSIRGYVHLRNRRKVDIDPVVHQSIDRVQ